MTLNSYSDNLYRVINWIIFRAYSKYVLNNLDFTRIQ